VPRAWLADEERFAEALAGFVALSIATSERRRTDNELRRVLEDGDLAGPRPEAPREKGRTSEGFDEDLGDA
jgi:GAF domain-containing protein